MTDIRAHLSFLSISAQKVRLVVDLVRGKNANAALDMLRFVPNRAAGPVRKATDTPSPLNGASLPSSPFGMFLAHSSM